MKAVRNYIETHDLTPRGVKIGPEDIREGLVAILSVFIADPQFQGQTKDRLNNAEVQAFVDGAVRPALEQWLNSNTRWPSRSSRASSPPAARARRAAPRRSRSRARAPRTG
jgi:DNA gyrase/topoisomerase IV subunit B